MFNGQRSVPISVLQSVELSDCCCEVAGGANVHLMADQLVSLMQERLAKHRDVFGLKRVIAAFESSLIRDASELGRLTGHLYR